LAELIAAPFSSGVNRPDRWQKHVPVEESERAEAISKTMRSELAWFPSNLQFSEREARIRAGV
jgi:hypothetical protein